MLNALLLITAAFLVVRLTIVIINLWQRPWMAENAPTTPEPAVAVLIPARNEADALPYLLSDLQAAAYPNLVVYVLDDASADGTAAVVRAYQASMANLWLLTGKPVPQGWLGKPWACHQLAAAAGEADYLLFVDADIRLSSTALNWALGTVQKRQLSLYTLFPRQHTGSLGEKLTVPVVYYTLATLIPLRLIGSSANPAFSAANGQFMMMEGKQYRHHQWHQQVHNHRVEDMGIMKLMKANGQSVGAELTHTHMSCRMYQGFQEAVAGFSKNFRAFYADSWGFMGFFMVFGVVAPLLLVVTDPTLGGAVLAVEIAGIRPMAAKLLGFCPREALILAVPQMIVTLYLAAHALLTHLYKQNQWKGRPIP